VSIKEDAGLCVTHPIQLPNSSLFFTNGSMADARICRAQANYLCLPCGPAISIQALEERAIFVWSVISVFTETSFESRLGFPDYVHNKLKPLLKSKTKADHI
jgi:hypothetical protein